MQSLFLLLLKVCVCVCGIVHFLSLTLPVLIDEGNKMQQHFWRENINSNEPKFKTDQC